MTARERILEAASRLFYANGMSLTGIDSITTEAGVAKKSLYNNFSSKSELMLSYIELRHEEWLSFYRLRVATASSGRESVLAVFDAYIDHAEFDYPEGFRGCGLLNAAAELPVGDAGRELVHRQKSEVEGLLLGHLRDEVDADSATLLAGQLSLLLEGAMSLGGLEGTSSRLHQARELAVSLLDTHCLKA